jgi:hypothetical protein
MLERRSTPSADASRFVVADRSEPGYRLLLRTGELARRVEAALAELA